LPPCCSSIPKGMLDNIKTLCYVLIHLILLETLFFIYSSSILLRILFKYVPKTYLHFNCRIWLVWTIRRSFCRFLNLFWKHFNLEHFPKINSWHRGSSTLPGWHGKGMQETMGIWQVGEVGDPVRGSWGGRYRRLVWGRARYQVGRWTRCQCHDTVTYSIRALLLAYIQFM